MSQEALEPNEIVGTYRIVRKVGEGGMGEVYEAWDPHLNRRVAIKILSKTLLADQEMLERFRAEGRALARLRHPNIVALYAQGEHKGHSYMAMEFVDGMTMDEFLVHHPCSISTLIDFFKQLLEGLSAAHEAGILHRDLKPQNILVGEDLEIKIVDFGVAKDHADQNSPKTSTNLVVGTAHYFAPEMVLGQPASAQTDLFALGLVFYFMVNGEPPFAGRGNLEVLEKIRTTDLVLSRRVSFLLPKAVHKVLSRLIKRRPEHRYTSAKQALADLAEADHLELPPEFTVSASPRILLANANEIRQTCKAENFCELEIRMIVNLALEHHHRVNDRSDATEKIDTAPIVILGQNSMLDGIRRFRKAKGQLGAMQLAADPQLFQPPPRRLVWLTPTITLGLIMAIGYWLLVDKKLTAHKPLVPPSEIVITPKPATKARAPAATKSGYALPDLKVGTAFRIRIDDLTSDKETVIRDWTLKSISGKEYIWETPEGDVKRVPQQNMSPVYAEQDIKNEMLGDPLSLFPLRVGSRMEFDVFSQQKSSNAKYKFICLATKKQRMRVEAGDFESILVECASDRVPVIKEFYNYSPQLQHWIRREIVQKAAPGIPETRTLQEVIGYTLPVSR